jgi:hypothetical protein
LNKDFRVINILVSIVNGWLSQGRIQGEGHGAEALPSKLKCITSCCSNLLYSEYC